MVPLKAFISSMFFFFGYLYTNQVEKTQQINYKWDLKWAGKGESSNQICTTLYFLFFLMLLTFQNMIVNKDIKITEMTSLVILVYQKHN